MDPNPPQGKITISADEIADLYTTNFLNHYNGDRRPFGIYLHAAVGVTLTDHVAGLLQFQRNIAKYQDVYWISNQKLLNWMVNPTDTAGALKSDALSCKMPATDPSNIEICDGIDNNGNGQVDEGLVTQCAFPSSQSSFSTCFGCPTVYPNVSQPVPPAAGNRVFVPDNGCPNEGVWDPIGGKCVNLKRMAKKTPTSPSSNGKNQGHGLGQGALYAGALAILINYFLF